MGRDAKTVGKLGKKRRWARTTTKPHREPKAKHANSSLTANRDARVARLTRELKEALDRQTATAGILQLIAGSPSDVQPVLDSVCRTAQRLCGAGLAGIAVRRGDVYRYVATSSANPEWDAKLRDTAFFPSRDSVAGRVLLERRAVHVEDLTADPEYGYPGFAAVGGARTALGVPLLREGDPIGVIFLGHDRVRPFTERQIEFVRTFADQAVIAIANARLFNEVQQRTNDLSESLQQQTATADVLKIISRFSGDLETVLDTLVETAGRLCRADLAHMFRRRDDMYHLVATRGGSEFLRTHPLTPDRGTVTGRAALERRAVHIPDVLQDPEYTYREGQKLVGYRTMLGVPLLRGETLVGILTLNRMRVDPYTTKEIELATSFADQAVIAIENARLFDELRERQAELRVTFDNMGDGVAMFDAAGRLIAWNRNFQDLLDLPDVFLGQRPTYVEYFRYLAERGEYSVDLEAELSRAVEDISREMRFERTRPDGRVIEVRRNPVPGGGFVLIYADITERKHAEDAIRRARDAAETALRELQTAQASLVHAQKMAALGQLTAGIAHEIKNPLNFINNFSALSVELIDELRQTLGGIPLDSKLRTEISEIADMLQSNLDKVVQHGKRADSIVKNMLLHSRQGSGEHRSIDINAIANEGLNLAYHGARAENPSFNITVHRNFDPAVGVVDGYPQEITRVLLNLISNGFYAATKRKAEAGDGFEPTLTATTKNLGDKVEIRIRDNGAGIPTEIKEKIFNPFFTTKPPGEGTGLGLSMSHDIIVKQHGGIIDVDTAPGAFTEFRIVLPRVGASLIKSGEHI
jgi:two-component system, NtrC family, sensor kinase